MTIKTSFRLIRGIIPWWVLSAIDAGGLVQAVVMGAEYSRCLRELNNAILEVSRV